jgi:hypothetical protein
VSYKQTEQLSPTICKAASVDTLGASWRPFLVKSTDSVGIAQVGSESCVTGLWRHKVTPGQKCFHLPVGALEGKLIGWISRDWTNDKVGWWPLLLRFGITLVECSMMRDGGPYTFFICTVVLPYIWGKSWKTSVRVVKYCYTHLFCIFGRLVGSINWSADLRLPLLF